MADHFYSVITADQTSAGVTVGTSSSSEAIELRVADGAGISSAPLSKLETLKAIMLIHDYIATHDRSA